MAYRRRCFHEWKKGIVTVSFYLERFKRWGCPICYEEMDPLVDERLLELKKDVGRYACERLRMGKARLVCWRGSSPHNWFVESLKKNILWHSSGWGDHQNTLIFRLVSESNDVIAHSFVHNDGGSPYESSYILREEFMLPKHKRSCTRRGRV